MTTIDTGTRQKVSPLFQFSWIIITAMIITTTFYFRLDYFRSLDEAMTFKNLTPEKLRDFSGCPNLVRVGLQIDHFQNFDVINNQFTFSGNVWFDFEGGAIEIDTLNDFNFDRATILYKSEPSIKLLGSRFMVRYLVKVQFNTGLVYADFPVDSHRINLVLTHPFLTPEEVSFENKADDFIFDGKLAAFGWNKIGLLVKQGYGEAHLSEQSGEKNVYQPLAGFSIDVSRYGIRSLIAIMLPLWLICFLMFFSISVDTNASITVALGGITGILAYRYVIEQLSPKTADLMISDYLFFVILASAILIFMLNQVDLFVMQLSQFKKKIAVSLIHIFMMATSIYLLLP